MSRQTWFSYGIGAMVALVLPSLLGVWLSNGWAIVLGVVGALVVTLIAAALFDRRGAG